MDAVSHCIETYLSPRENPPAEAIALDGAGAHRRAISSAQSATGAIKRGAARD
jgi:4-hydroxybutyrate dehydrogenase